MFTILSPEGWDIILRLIVAIGLGAALGVERSLAKKTAGMRTYALVSLGSALFVIIAELAGKSYLNAGAGSLDPLRMASQVIVGIGFLGAGLIIFKDDRLRGLTTAAGLWVAAGIGMAAGLGFHTLAIIVAVLTLIIFTVLWHLEQWLEKQIDRG